MIDSDAMTKGGYKEAEDTQFVTVKCASSPIQKEKQKPLTVVQLPRDEHCPYSDEIAHTRGECTFPDDLVPIPLASAPFFVALLAPGNSGGLASIVVVRVVGVVPFPDIRSDPHLDRTGDAGGRTDHSPTQEGSAMTIILEENEGIVGGGPADCLES